MKNETYLHPLQTDAWAAFRKRMGIVVDSIGSWHISFHRVPYTPYTIGYFPKGPMPTKEMIEELLILAKKHNAIYIQIEPNVEKDLAFSIGHLAFIKHSHRALFTKYTFLIDLTKSEEELLKIMHPKTRYNIKVAEKHGVIIQEDNSDKAFATYLTLSQETTKRQGFFAHDTHYHKTMWEELRNAGIAHLFTATYENEIIATWIIFIVGKRMYYPYGASSRNHTNVMAPTLLLWKLMLWGKKEGYDSFDLWGAMGPEPDVTDPWYGFHRFKAGFSPRHITYVGSFDLIAQPFLYRVFTLADKIRWFLLHLKRK